MINQNVVDQLTDFKQEILKRTEEAPIILVPHSIRQINLNQSGKDTLVELNDKILSKRAVKDLADRFRIKSKFFQLGKEMGKEELNEITDKLKNLKDEDILCEETGNTIKNIYFAYPEKKRKVTANLEVINNLDRVIQNVSASDKAYSINRLSFSDQQMVNIELLTDETLEVLDNDPWKIGVQTNFSKTEFNVNPLLLRKICTNGMMAAPYGFQSNISQMKWNTEKIEEEIMKIFLNPNDSMKDIIKENVQILKNSNISIAELNKTKNVFFKNIDDEAKAAAVVKNFFNDTQLTQFYGNLEEKTHQFLKTADTGINAYDHFNMLTWITSHLNESKISSDDQFKINLRAGDILFAASELDMNQIAPKLILN